MKNGGTCIRVMCVRANCVYTRFHLASGFIGTTFQSYVACEV